MNLTKSQLGLVFSAVSCAIQDVYKHDSYLIQNKVNERTIVNKFAYYFQVQLNHIGYSGYHLDVEYNKNHSNPKRTINFQRGTYPDIIVHQRGSNENNLCLIEFKTWWRKNTDRDLRKLKDFTNQNYQYKYGVGFSITLNRDAPYIQTLKNNLIIENPQKREVVV